MLSLELLRIQEAYKKQLSEGWLQNVTNAGLSTMANGSPFVVKPYDATTGKLKDADTLKKEQLGNVAAGAGAAAMALPAVAPAATMAVGLGTTTASAYDAYNRLKLHAHPDPNTLEGQMTMLNDNIDKWKLEAEKSGVDKNEYINAKLAETIKSKGGKLPANPSELVAKAKEAIQSAFKDKVEKRSLQTTRDFVENPSMRRTINGARHFPIVGNAIDAYNNYHAYIEDNPDMKPIVAMAKGVKHAFPGYRWQHTQPHDTEKGMLAKNGVNTKITPPTADNGSVDVDSSFSD